MTTNFSQSPNPHRLYKDKKHGVLAGVCAGISRYFGFDLTLVRVAAIILLFVFTPVMIVGYIIAALIMPSEPVKPVEITAEESDFWRGVAQKPETTFSNLKYTFRDLEERLQDLERLVTSDEYKLRRQFKEIE